MRPDIIKYLLNKCHMWFCVLTNEKYSLKKSEKQYFCKLPYGGFEKVYDTMRREGHYARTIITFYISGPPRGRPFGMDTMITTIN